MANRAPGVYRNEVNAVTSINSRVDNVVAIVGTAKTGPIEPTFVYSAQQREQVFGPVLDSDYGLFAVDKILENTNAVLFCRVVNKGGKALFKDTNTTIFEAKEGGIHLDNAIVNLVVEDELITVTLTVDEVALETIVVSSNKNSNEYIHNVFNSYSQYLNIVADQSVVFASRSLTTTKGSEGAKESIGTSVSLSAKTKHFDSLFGGAVLKVMVDTTGGISASLSKNGKVVESVPALSGGETAEEFKIRFNKVSQYVEITDYPEVTSCSVTLVAGNDGIANIKASDYVGNSNMGIKALDDTDTVEISTLIVPGKFDPQIVSACQAVVNTRQDCLYIADPPLGLRAYATKDWVDGTGAYASGVRLDSDYACVFSPWVASVDHSNNVVYIPPSIAMACLLVFNDATKNVWDAPSGVRNGVLSGVVGLEYVPTKADKEILYTNSVINPIAYVKDVGYCVWGNKTARRAKYPLNPEPACSLNVRRLVNHIKKKTSAVALELLFANNDSFTWDEFKLNLDPILRAIKDNRGLYDYDIIIDETTVTQEMIDALRMPAIIRLRPTRAAEVIELSFELNGSDVSITDNGQ